MARFDKFDQAWQWLNKHPIFSEGGASYFDLCWYMEVVKVNPITKKVEDDSVLNTELSIQLECGPWIPVEKSSDLDEEDGPTGIASFKHSLDCGAPTFEVAIINLANLVLEEFGNY